jgi:hypothetical protein
MTAGLVLKSTPPRHRLPRLLSASWGTARDSTCRRTSGVDQSINEPLSLLLQVSGHLAGRAGGHAPARMQRSTSPRICTLCVRALRTRRARPVNEACAYAAAGRGAALPTCARAHIRTCAEMCPRLRAACASPATRPPAPHPLGTRQTFHTKLVGVESGDATRCAPQRREPA